MKVYTKRGDEGNTSLIGGTRVPKHHIRIEAYGTIDELNSHMGLIRDQKEFEEHLGLIKVIQNSLFTIGSLLASDPDASRMKLPELTESDILLLEKSIDNMETQLPALTNFVLPGGHPANSMAHVARCVCRRAERNVVHLNEISTVPPLILSYLNRLSDWLFVLSRYASHISGSQEILWESN